MFTISGVVGCQVAVVSIDTTKQSIISHKMKNVNSYNEIGFSDSGMTVRQAYGIGDGLFLSEDRMEKLSEQQNDTGCLVHQGFTKPQMATGTVKFDSAKEASESQSEYEFSCTEAGCQLKFSSYESLEAHVLLEDHQTTATKETTYDKIRLS